MADIKDVIETLDTATAGFEKVVTKSQAKIYEEAITLLHELDVKNGKVVQSIANLKRLNAIKAKLKNVANSSEYLAGLGKFVQYFDALAKQQSEYFTEQFAEAALDKNTDKVKRELIRKQARENTIAALSGDGLAANVTGKINDMLVRAVTSGAKFADLTKELHSYLQGTDGGQGALARYATTYATTAISQYTGQNNKIMTENVDTDWFMYVGSTIETTREFCDCLTAKRYIHRSEFRKIISGDIDGHQCKIYAKTGLPLGMIEGTNEDNFQVNCGGWNCRHQLVPVSEFAVPADVRARLKNGKITPDETPLANKKGVTAFRDAAYQFGYNGYDDLTIDHAMSLLKKYGVEFEVAPGSEAIENLNAFNRAVKAAKERKSVAEERRLEFDYLHQLVTDGQIKSAMKLRDESGRYKVTYLINNGLSYEEAVTKSNEFVAKIEAAINSELDLGEDTPLYDKSKLELLKKSLAVKKSVPQLFCDVDKRSPNPEYGESKKYNVNCQRCVVTFEMRARGLDVHAQGARTTKNGKVSKLDAFIKGTEWMGEDAWTTNSGVHPQKISIWDPDIRKSKQNFKRATSSVGRYIMYVAWDGGGAHVVNVIHSKSGSIHIYDPQTGRIMKFGYYHENCVKKSWALTLWRVDNANLNEYLANVAMIPNG